MVLQSQMPRDGANRRYVASARRRNSPKWPWFLVGAAAIVVLWIMFRGDDPPTNAQAGETASQNDNADTTTGRDASVTANTTANRTPQADILPRNNGTTGRTMATTQQAQTTPRTPPQTTLGDLATTRTVTQTSPPQTQLQPRQHTAVPRDTGNLTPDILAQFKKGLQLRDQGRLVEARKVLNDLLWDHERELTVADKQNIRETMARINDELIFSPKEFADDPLTEQYTVQQGDRLSIISPKYRIPYQIVEDINNVNAHRIRVGQKLKFIKGPFHAMVSKHEYRIDLYLDSPDGRLMYITSFPVGLGEEGSTPVGTFKVGTKRGPENGGPSWANPRTGERFAPDDPLNPIGEAWIALIGTDGGTADLQSYGIHGTIDPESIGRQRSMGCIRMRHDDVLKVFNMLTTEHSVVSIVP